MMKGKRRCVSLIQRLRIHVEQEQRTRLEDGIREYGIAFVHRFAWSLFKLDGSEPVVFSVLYSVFCILCEIEKIAHSGATNACSANLPLEGASFGWCSGRASATFTLHLRLLSCRCRCASANLRVLHWNHPGACQTRSSPTETSVQILVLSFCVRRNSAATAAAAAAAALNENKASRQSKRVFAMQIDKARAGERKRLRGDIG